MNLLFNDKDDLKKDVDRKFGEGKNYLIAMKHNSPEKSGLKLLLSNLYYTYDNNRTPDPVFDPRGIYEKEISNTDKADFYLMPEGEIENYAVEKKGKKARIHFDHLGKQVSYEIPFTGRLFEENEKNFDQLTRENWEKI